MPTSVCDADRKMSDFEPIIEIWFQFSVFVWSLRARACGTSAPRRDFCEPLSHHVRRCGGSNIHPRLTASWVAKAHKESICLEIPTGRQTQRHVGEQLTDITPTRASSSPLLPNTQVVDGLTKKFDISFKVFRFASNLREYTIVIFLRIDRNNKRKNGAV